MLLSELAHAASRGPSVVAAAGDGRSALLTLRGDIDLSAHPTLKLEPAVLRRTDVAVLHSGILEQILGIDKAAQAAKTNVWYVQDAGAALGELRAGKGDVLFAMNPTTVAQVRDVAESGEVMPQKSTFFYPKVPTGLVFQYAGPEAPDLGRLIAVRASNRLRAPPEQAALHCLRSAFMRHCGWRVKSAMLRMRETQFKSSAPEVGMRFVTERR